MFWRSTNGKAAAEKPAGSAWSASESYPALPQGELDLRLIGEQLARKRWRVIIPTMLAGLLSVAAVNMVTPRYRS